MLEVHIKAMENILRAEFSVKELKTVEHWNNQVANANKENPFYPAALIDFGTINWKRMMGDTYQTGACIITVHGINYNYRITRDKAPDDDGRRLSRFDWIAKLLNTLNGASAVDRVGNIIFNRLNLVTSLMDTNHAALWDDHIQFSCVLNYYGWWYGKKMEEILITSVETEGNVII